MHANHATSVCSYALSSRSGGVQLETDRFGRLFHSPLVRAARTAEIVWGSRAGPIAVLPSLREVDLYSFQARM